jgi:glycosyltransferase involved in cell wall biosynthesis
MPGKILILYHFFYPDDVVSSRHFSDLAEGLAGLGWDVTVFTSNRMCRNPNSDIKLKEEVWQGVKISRLYRPNFKQASNMGRILNSVWMMLAWLVKIIRRPAFDVVIFGTDPQFSYFIVPFVKLFRRRTKIAYWGYDLYPEIIIASEKRITSLLGRLVKPIARLCYRKVDLMVDIGPCMRKILSAYGHSAQCETLVPWALTESQSIPAPDESTRANLFGKCSIAILYSGTVGKAHTFTEFLMLARELRKRDADVVLCFAGRGNEYDSLRSAVSQEDTNVRFAGFAQESELKKRLGAADLHMVSLRDGWEGLVLPSKFFGALAAGRPVLFAGTKNSSIKHWIDEYDVGFHLHSSNTQAIADKLCSFSLDRNALKEMQQRAFLCYQANFARKIMTRRWSDCLRQCVSVHAPDSKRLDEWSARDLASQVLALREVVDQASLDQLAHSVHILRDASSSACMPSAMQKVVEIERLIVTGEIDSIRVAVDDLAQLYRHTAVHDQA